MTQDAEDDFREKLLDGFAAHGLTNALLYGSAAHAAALLVRAEAAERERDAIGISLRDEVTTRLDAEAARDRLAIDKACMRQIVSTARAHFNVEYCDDGKIVALSHDSKALAKVVAALDAVLAR